VVELEKTLVKVVLEDLEEETLGMDLAEVKELLIKVKMEEMVLAVEHMVTPVRVAVELELKVDLYTHIVMAVSPVLVDTVKLLQLTDHLQHELVVEAVDLTVAIAPVLVEMEEEMVLLGMVPSPLLLILVEVAVVAQATPVLGAVEMAHLVL
jgi:hypothetical protein